MTFNNLEQKLRLLKVRNRWRDRDLAAQIGIRPSTLRVILDSNIIVKVDDFANICELLGESPNQMMNWKEEEKPEPEE